MSAIAPILHPQPPETRRERIAIEACRRLATIHAFANRDELIRVEEGYSGLNYRQCPLIAYYEDTETSVLDETVRRGLYEHQLVVQIEYFRPCIERGRVQPIGRRMLAEVIYAFEVDEFFAIGGHQDQFGQTQDVLAKSYSRRQSEIRELEENIVLLLVEYRIRYTESHLGITCQV